MSRSTERSSERERAEIPVGQGEWRQSVGGGMSNSTEKRRRSVAKQHRRVSAGEEGA
jgi:hypothetical protein